MNRATCSGESAARNTHPKPDAVYTFNERDAAGFSTKYDVKDPDGIEWNAKIGPEAQTEVVLSRILWGLGYHQQPIYYLPSWTMDQHGIKSTISEARFRPKLQGIPRLDEVLVVAAEPVGRARAS